MLTSSANQYLRPEYLTPLPTTLDAKKSPLALLAQTCSQIGADSPNSKLLQSSEKSSKKPSSDNKGKSTPVTESQKTNNYKHQMDNIHSLREKSRTPEERSGSANNNNRIKTPNSNASFKNGGNTPNGRCSSNQSAASPRGSPANSNSGTKTPGDCNDRVKSPEKSADDRSGSQTPSSVPKTAFTPNILTSSSDPAFKDLPLGTFKPGVPPVSSAFTGYPLPGFPHLPADLMTSSFLSRTSALSPYFSYGRLKTQDSLSVCRDPYCTGCSVSSHLLGASVAGVKSPPCPAGCTQCDHAKTAAQGYMSHSPAAAAYAHAQLAALAAASHLPYICNWISGDASYCGKRFSSSEELLSHLRTHTSVTSEASSLTMLGSPGLPTHPLFHRTYPTPPLSPLATARYHPYSKPSLLPPSLSGLPFGHPSLPPYLSPYSIYGPRLGATPGMHP